MMKLFVAGLAIMSICLTGCSSDNGTESSPDENDSSSSIVNGNESSNDSGENDSSSSIVNGSESSNDSGENVSSSSIVNGNESSNDSSENVSSSSIVGGNESLSSSDGNGLNSSSSQDEMVKDADGNVYPTVKIGNQIWMAKNLNVNVKGSMCYDNDPANCEKYGRLYTWDAAKKACPAGWHLPTEEEYKLFIEAVELRLTQIETQKKLNAEPLREGETSVSKNLHSAEWDGYDSFGFSVLPAGCYSSNREEFDFLGRLAFFWSSTECHRDSAYSFSFYSAGVNGDNKDFGYSVRCLQD